MRSLDYNKYRRYGYPFFWVIMFLIFYLINPLDAIEKELKTYTTFTIAADLIGSFVYAILTLEIGIQLTIFLNKKIPWENAISKRLLLQLILQIVLVAVCFSFLYFLPVYGDSRIDWLQFRQALVISVLFSVLVTAFLTAEYFFRKMAASQMEAIKQRQSAAQFQFEALKTQLDPHFLFNNFSVLTALIEEDSEQAVKYVSVLSSVYRYVLQSNKQSLIKLDDELAFLDVYFYLYKIRFADAIRLKKSIDNRSKEDMICPMSLQLLIENAVKHNVVQKEKPLEIDVFVEENWLVCSNNVLAKQGKPEGFGIGLHNLQQRYSLITDRTIEIHNSDGRFTVKIPLIRND
jgi:sensor histidine kinase YesM